MLITSGDADQGDRLTAAAEGLVARDVTKTFGPTVALRDVSVTFAAGQVHGLVGENGSGKSTFVKIVAGMHRADSGLVTYAGAELDPGRQHAGPTVSCVYQDGSLIDELTVGQNLELMVSPAERAAFETGEKSWQSNLLDAFGLSGVRPDAVVGQIHNYEQRLVEIAATLVRRPDVLLFDESTSTLDETAVAVVLDWMREAAARGACVIFVTHRLREVLSVASHIVVLRDGAVVQEFAAGELDEHQVVEAMAGRRVATLARRPVADLGDVVLRAEDLVTAGSGPNTIEVRRGEIVGLGGAAGNGQGELARALAGQGIRSGVVTADGRRLRRAEDGPAAGVLFVSSDRRHESLYPELSVRENFTLGYIGSKTSPFRWLRRRPEAERARELTERLGVVVASIEAPVTSMSGGNQQKVAIGRAMESAPDVLVVEEPSEGVDVRSRLDIYRSLFAAADSGMAVVVASTDASELRLLADRVIVMAQGRQVASLAGEEVTEQAIVHSFSTAHARQRADETENGARRARSFRPWAGASGRPARAWNLRNLLLLVLMIVVLAVVAANNDPKFLSARGIGAICILALPIMLVSLAQLPILLSGQLDASLGAMMGLIVVFLSFFGDTSWPVLLVGSVVVGALLGALNAGLVVKLGITPMIATVATLGIFSGASMILRSQPGGVISASLTKAVNGSWGTISFFFLAVVVLAIAADVVIGVTRAGLALRAVGFSAVRSMQLGLSAHRFQIASYVIGGAVAGVGGAVLAARTGVGDGSVGLGFTLLSFAVPVIGGAALGGGIGSAVGCVLGALFIAEIGQFVPFMSLPSGYYLVAIGALTLLALMIGSRNGRVRI